MTIPGSAKDGVGKFERDNGERTSGEQRDPAAKSEKKKIDNPSMTMTKTKPETETKAKTEQAFNKQTGASEEQRDPANKSEKKKIYDRSKTMTKTKSETIKEQACNVNG